ncbi:putative nicotine oxidoreductase [Amblyomma americanum]
MFGFRAKLSTQDVLLQIKEVLTQVPYNGENVIMALDVKGTCDNVGHAVIDGLNNANFGKKIHDYTRAFLSNRTAMVGIGELRGEKINTPNKGTPQGSVISPVLFNIVMIELARRLGKIEDIGFAIYADDIKIWANQGTLG